MLFKDDASVVKCQQHVFMYSSITLSSHLTVHIMTPFSQHNQNMSLISHIIIYLWLEQEICGPKERLKMIDKVHIFHMCVP